MDGTESEGEKNIEYQMKKIVDKVKEIRIDTYMVGYQQCAVTAGCLHPQNSMEAKFSTPYSVAAAFLYGQVNMREFEPDVVTNIRVQQLLEKVHVFPAERFFDTISGTLGMCHESDYEGRRDVDQRSSRSSRQHSKAFDKRAGTK